MKVIEKLLLPGALFFGSISSICFVLAFATDEQKTWINNFFISNIGTDWALPAFSTLVAAFAGAYGSQFIIERSKKYDSIVAEIRNTNVAIVAAMSVFNTSFNVKNQHVQTLKNQYAENIASRNIIMTAQVAGLIIEPQPFLPDFESIQPLIVPTEMLHKQVFEKMDADARPIALASQITQSIHSLNESLRKRNELVEDFRLRPTRSTADVINFYFGSMDSQGMIDNSYPSILQAIFAQLDDCIFFSKLLCEDLRNHAFRLREKLQDNSVLVMKPDFSTDKIRALLPDPEQYKDWETSFNKIRS